MNVKSQYAIVRYAENQKLSDEETQHSYYHHRSNTYHCKNANSLLGSKQLNEFSTH